MNYTADFRGSLKQQCLDSSGLYEWVKRIFVLRINEGILDIYAGQNDQLAQSHLSLSGARHAREWSISSAIAGYGFDIVWASGKMWSFLADSESDCFNWSVHLCKCIKYEILMSTSQHLTQRIHDHRVSKVNFSIEATEMDLNKTVDAALNKSSEDFRNMLGVRIMFDEVVPQNHDDRIPSDYINQHDKLRSRKILNDHARYDSDGSENDTTTEFHSPMRSSKQYFKDSVAPSTLPRYSNLTRTSAAYTPKIGSQNNMYSSARGKLNISEIPIVDSGSDHSSPNALSESTEEKESPEVDESESETYRKISYGRSEDRPERDSTRCSRSNSMGLGSTVKGSDDLETSALRIRCQSLCAAAESDRAEMDKLRRQVGSLQEELEESLYAIEKSSLATRKKERETFQASQADVHAKIVRATEERDILHEANVRATQEQYSREMAGLREELLEARKRYGEELTRESALRDATEGKEIELNRENASLRDSISRLNAERLRMTEISKTDSTNWLKDRESLIASADDIIATLRDEREAFTARAQSELRSKISELTEKFSASAMDMERSVRETVMQETAAERIREIGAMQKKCTKDIQAARTDEKRTASKEVESVRAFYQEREKQTAQDLSELERLHLDRLQRLEGQLAIAKNRQAAAEDSLNVTMREQALEAEDSKSTSGRYFKHLEDSAARAEDLAADLGSLHSELQESRVRESVYRDQLARVLDDARVKNAMLLEAQKQASEGSAQAHQWRKAVAVIDNNQSTTATHLQISRDEITMLEHDLKRLKSENSTLRMRLEKADRLVYGSVHAFHSPAPEVGRKLNSATRSESPGRGTRKNKSAPSSTSSMNGLRASTGATSGSFNLNTCVGGGAGTGAGLSTSRSSGSGCGCSACGGQGSNHSHHGRNHSPLRGSTGRTTHPPWRSGMCNCSCKASWCRCLGNGAPVTS